MQDERPSFKGMLTIDDTTLAPRGFLMHGRLKWILFKPPFDSHGAAQPRQEHRPPCFLCAEWKPMIQSIRGSAAGCLDGVVPG
jgi:hypothetical protein